MCHGVNDSIFSKATLVLSCCISFTVVQLTPVSPTATLTIACAEQAFLHKITELIAQTSRGFSLFLDLSNKTLIQSMCIMQGAAK